MDSLYNTWQQTCLTIAESRESSWKQDRTVHYMLEHVPGEYARIYLDLIVTSGLSFHEIQTYTNLVDQIGDAQRHTFPCYSEALQSSTTCLRYLWHAIEIVNHLNDYFEKGVIPTLVELGGGYGGLAVAVNYILQLRKKEGKLQYKIVDLTNVQKLQAYYTSQFTLDCINLEFVDSEQYGANINASNIFIVSNYCIAEMGEANRRNYIDALFSKKEILGGYLQWNSPASTDCLNQFRLDITEEHPKTGPNNKTVIFYRQ
jgi:hypothetical protein